MVVDLFNWLKQLGCGSYRDDVRLYGTMPAQRKSKRPQQENLLIQVGPPPLAQPQAYVQAPSMAAH